MDTVEGEMKRSEGERRRIERDPEKESNRHGDKDRTLSVAREEEAEEDLVEEEV